ncbi:hypothetical protein Sjap_010420 [Stephania japonica]|uniref:Uncharacterized protein n=1 Tax=Stephania japonica TaxID=461633 RepID=A0AAP0JBK2_9MAGN
MPIQTNLTQLIWEEGFEIGGGGGHGVAMDASATMGSQWRRCWACGFGGNGGWCDGGSGYGLRGGGLSLMAKVGAKAAATEAAPTSAEEMVDMAALAMVIVVTIVADVDANEDVCGSHSEAGARPD